MTASATDYHRAGLAYRTTRPAWWRPLVELAMLGVLIVVFTVAVTLPVGFAAGHYGVDDIIFDEGSSDPLAALMQVFFIAIWLPAPFLAARIAGRAPGALWSAAGRLRWGVFGRALAVVLAVYGGQVLVDAILFDDAPTHLTTRQVQLIAAFVIVVPLQAAAEEFVFRGALPQILGQWIRPGWICYGLPAVAFVASHAYNWVGLVDISIFAFCTALLAWRTRGVEATVALHAVSNTVVFTYGALGMSDPSETEITPEQTIMSSLLTIGVTVLLLWVLREKSSANSVVSASSTA